MKEKTQKIKRSFSPSPFRTAFLAPPFSKPKKYPTHNRQKTGYTRSPVWEGHRQNIIGILYTKDLILVDPDDEVEVRAIIALQNCAGGNLVGGSDGVQYILDVTPLNEVFKLFKTCGTHLMVR